MNFKDEIHTMQKPSYNYSTSIMNAEDGWASIFAKMKTHIAKQFSKENLHGPWQPPQADISQPAIQAQIM